MNDNWQKMMELVLQCLFYDQHFFPIQKSEYFEVLKLPYNELIAGLIFWFFVALQKVQNPFKSVNGNIKLMDLVLSHEELFQGMISYEVASAFFTWLISHGHANILDICKRISLTNKL